MNRFFTLSVSLFSLFLLASCDLDSETHYEGTCMLVYSSGIDSTIVYANVQADSSATASYQADFIDATGGFVLGHWVADEAFAGGLTLTYGHNDSTATAANYASIVGHGSGELANGNYTTAYYVGDIATHPAAVLFYPSLSLGIPCTPSSIAVTNASYTYLAMRDGWTDASGNAHAPYTGKLYLRITGLSKLTTTSQPASTGTHVDVELAADGQFLRSWKSVTLNAIGSCYGLRFELVDGSGNTVTSLPRRFCVDALVASYNSSI